MLTLPVLLPCHVWKPSPSSSGRQKEAETILASWLLLRVSQRKQFMSRKMCQQHLKGNIWLSLLSRWNSRPCAAVDVPDGWLPGNSRSGPRESSKENAVRRLR